MLVGCRRSSTTQATLKVFGQVGIRERLSLAVATCKSFRSLRTVKSLWETLDLTELNLSGKGFVRLLSMQGRQGGAAELLQEESR